MPLAPLPRLAALAVALAALAALAAQLAVSLGLAGSLPAALWAMGRFFTILTNCLVLASFGVMAARGRALPAAWLAGLALWIAIVGVVYHLLLAALSDPVGLAWWADQGLHSAVPVLAVLWWVGFAPKPGLGWHHAVLWLGWPLAYSVYALGRGALDGRYPYPFLDVAALGYGGVALNALGMTAGFLAAGLAVVALSRRLSR